MPADALERFARSIEAAFYKKDVASFRAALAAEEAEAAGALGRATGIDDPDLLARLAELGIRPETLAALTLIPLIETAWADGVMHAKERDAVLRGAATSGIAPASASYRLLELWTIERPAREIAEIWREFIAAIAKSLSERERDCAALEGDRPRVGGRERGGRLPRCDPQRFGRRARRARCARCRVRRGRRQTFAITALRPIARAIGEATAAALRGSARARADRRRAAFRCTPKTAARAPRSTSRSRCCDTPK